MYFKTKITTYYKTTVIMLYMYMSKYTAGIIQLLYAAAL